MQKSKVAVIKCTSYRPDGLKAALEQGINLLGGIDKFARRGEKILFKPNVLFGDHPDKCTATHPAVLRAAGSLFKACGADLYYGDSPGIGPPVLQLKLGQFTTAAEELGIKLGDFQHGKAIATDKLEQIKSLTIANAALDADGIINLCKMKTHQLTRITCAVKNMFGCIPGLLKPEFHIRTKSVYHFCSLLVVISQILKPRLHIADGISAMEGNGPRGGEPVHLDTLLFSEDPVALDVVMCRLINLDPAFVPTITEGARMGLGRSKEEEIELLGEPVSNLIQPAFKVVREPVPDIKQKSAINFFINWYIHRPVINPTKCIKCGICVNTCPVTPGAVNWRRKNKQKPPVYSYLNCIRCFCCQEVCPEKAITVRRPLLGRILFAGKRNRH